MVPNPKVRPVPDAKDKFVRRVSVAGPDYEKGVKNPLRDWLTEFTDALEKMSEGIKEAIEEGRVEKGAARRGTGFWKERASRKGPPRWRDETPKAGDTWAKEWSPFRDAIEATPLEKKKRKGDPANIDNRVKPIVSALIHKKKEVRGVTPKA